MDESRARAILTWRYEPPYDAYNEIEEALHLLLDPQNAYYVLVDRQEELVAYCCFGPDAQVLGGSYSYPALDIGLGVRPDLTGQGRGHLFVEAVLGFARQLLAPTLVRVTVAEFNRRALRVWTKAGFQQAQQFQRIPDGMPFVILMRQA